MYDNKAVTLPQYKIDHIIENGSFAYVILILTYNPKLTMPWSYSFYTEGSYPSKERSHAKRYHTTEEASHDIETMVELASAMRYSTTH